MLSLLLLASGASALATSGDMILLYGMHKTDLATSTAKCRTDMDGTTAGSSTLKTDVANARPIILGNCYTTAGAGAAGTRSDLIFGNEIGAAMATGTDGEKNVGFIFANATEVKFQIGTDTTSIEMIPYTGTADNCATGNQTAVKGTDTSNGNGWQCQANSSFGMGILNGTTNGKAAVIPGVKYLSVRLDADNTTDGTRECQTAQGITVLDADGYGTAVTSLNTDYWPVCQTAADCVPGICTEANTAADFTGNATACLADAAAPTFGNLVDDKTAYAALAAAACIPNRAANAGSSQLGCDRETGRIIRNYGHATAHCASFAYSSPYGTASSQILHKQNMAIFPTSGAGNSTIDTDKSICVTNSVAEFEAVCDMQKFGGTAKKWFVGYRNKTQSECATYGGTTAIAAEKTKGTRAVFVDVCYNMNTADGASRWAGWAGPFVQAGATDTIITAGTFGSRMFKEVGAEIKIWNYATHDCSGAYAEVASDDPADTWCQSPAAISHGNVGTSGNAAAALQTATTFLQVRQHKDAIAAGVGFPGSCLNGSSVVDATKAGNSGEIVDYFFVNNGLGNTPATGCHQTEFASAANTSDAQSYAWWCDTSTASIYYATFFDQACSAGKMLPNALRFTKFAYTACTESTTGAGYDAGNTTCTAGGPTFSTVADATTDASGETMEGPADYVFAAADITTSAWGAATQFGGRCLQSGTNTSWELVLTDAEYDAICSVPTAASSEDAAASSAAKVAATAAAAAAAAILL